MSDTDSDADTTGDGVGARPDPSLLRWGTDTRWLGGLVLLGLLAGCWQLGEFVGVIVWVIVAGSWVVFPPIVPVAVGQLGLVALTSDETALVEFAVVQAPLLGILVADGIISPAWAGTASIPEILADTLAYAGIVAVVSALLLFVADRDGVLLAVVAGAVIVAVVSYGLHRYLLVALGEVTEQANA